MADEPQTEQRPVYTVTSLTQRLRETIEPAFTRVTLEAEISGFKIYPSGTAYFTLKDADAQISAIMFKPALERCKAKHPGILESLKDGVKIQVFGNVTIYPARGTYRIVVFAAKLAGEGELMQQYIELRNKLAAEGLFDSSRKKPLPKLPRRIGIVTSEAGAVIHDMCTVLTRRFPNLEIRLYPALVQGAEAPRTLIKGIEYFQSIQSGWTPDLIIIARGGGSFEDLFCFNDEQLVRALAACRIPTISAVGHENDFTLCDFAADVRAGTPSIAAEIAVPVLDDLRHKLDHYQSDLQASLETRLDWATQRLDHLTDALASALTSAAQRASVRLEKARAQILPALRLALAQSIQRVRLAQSKMTPALTLTFSQTESRLTNAAAKLKLLSPYGVLDRGYALVTDANGAVLRDATIIPPKTKINVRLAKGELTAAVLPRRNPS